MKKKISFLFMIALIAYSLIMPCVADEPELVTEITTELVTEMLEETPEATEPPAETEPEVTEPDAPVEDVDEWAEFKDKITDSATWTMIGTAVVTILTNAALIVSKFGKVTDLVRNKADNDTVKGELKDLEKTLKAAYNENHKEVAATLKRYEEALKNKEDNEQKLYAMFALFMTNVKISETAKEEILAILMGIKKYDGDPFEIVAQAQEAIENAKEEAPKTPTLDQMLDEDYMELG